MLGVDPLRLAGVRLLRDELMQPQVGSSRPPRICSSAVLTASAPASMFRSCSDFAENPPKTTECVAPTRAHACMATTPSIDIGM